MEPFGRVFRVGQGGGFVCSAGGSALRSPGNHDSTWPSWIFSGWKEMPSDHVNAEI